VYSLLRQVLLLLRAGKSQDPGCKLFVESICIHGTTQRRANCKQAVLLDQAGSAILIVAGSAILIVA
jgi:hypothetical protein